jgi:ribose transport system substrate-binding protein
MLVRPRPGRRWAAALGATLAVAAFTVAACGGNDNGGGGAGGGGGGGGGGGAKMTLIAGVKGDEFYITMNCGAQQKAKQLGVSLDFQGPDQFDPSQQTPVVNAVAAKKPDAVLIAPTDTRAMFAPINQLAQGGSKVVLVDTTLDQPDIAVSQIASDNIGGGRAAARALADLIGGKGKVFVSNVKPGISTTDLRAKGFQEEAEKLGLDFVGVQYNDDAPEKAASIVKAQLAKHPDLKGVFATNLFGAEGSASGVREAGKTGSVKIVGFDAGPKQVKDLQDGLLQAIIAQRPALIGADGVQQAYNALNDKPVRKKIGTGFITLTKDNLEKNRDAVYKSSC